MTKLRAILWGGLFVGLFDILDAIIYFGIRNGVSPGRVFQSVARGLLGRDAFSGGMATMALGAILHFSIAMAVAATCVVLSRWVTGLAKRPLVFGPVYGAGVFAFMYLVVLPLSRVGWVRFDAPGFVNALLIHMLGIGIPSALAARAAGRLS
jgi:uncharacterized membrane protein YagU involved in acid resistance